MTPKEQYEARRAARRADDATREANASKREDIDPEDLIFDIANSLDRIATALEAHTPVTMSGDPV